MDQKRLNIEQAKQLAKLNKKLKQLIPEIYSCFAKVLYDEYKWDGDQIEELFVKTEHTWQENADNMNDMITWTSETTGIELRGPDYI